MKNYPHFYPTPISKKVNKLNQTPKKNIIVTNNLLNSKPSQKTMITYNTLKREKSTHIRNMTRSIQQMRIHSDAENDEIGHDHTLENQTEDQQLFSQSYSKIGKIKKSFPYKNIDNELNQVLSLIRQQKAKISQKMKALKRSNDQYKKLCENYQLKKSECGVNTEQMIISGRQIVCMDQSIECQFAQQIKIVDEELPHEPALIKESNVKNRQMYSKIANMLQQMNINPKQILPQSEIFPDQIVIADYNTLTEKQIIKIQKFFIKKLISKIPK